ncbi:MAG: hypothetical protein AB7D39_20090 [Pseudodesulfovibrio sp.]
MRRVKTVVISCIMVAALALIVGMNVTAPGTHVVGNGSAETAHTASLDG